MSTQKDLTAIIYDRKGRILSIGKNSYVKTHPLQSKFASRNNLEKKIFIHAEISAIIRCRNIEEAYKLRVFRFLRNGLPGLAAPCEICADAIKTLTDIRVIEYTSPDVKGYYEYFLSSPRP